MEQEKNLIPQKRNPISQKKHQREFLLQILLPIGIFIVLFILLWIIFSFTDFGTISSWSSISFIFLALFILLFTIILFVIILYLTIGTGKILTILPEKTYSVQRWLKKVSQTITSYSNKAVKPFISTKSWISLNQLRKKDSEENEK